MATIWQNQRVLPCDFAVRLILPCVSDKSGILFCPEQAKKIQWTARPLRAGSVQAVGTPKELIYEDVLDKDASDFRI